MRKNQILERLARRNNFGIKPGLTNITHLLDLLGNPHQAVAAVHIGGTNGKGSVAALCESVLRAAGFKTGRYTSPHLMTLNERFLLNGKMVENQELEDALCQAESAATQLEERYQSKITYFELLTAVAFLLFKNNNINLTVIECGLGGRWDATNVALPLVAVITQVALDHCDLLGNTLREIALEKAGIIKEGCRVVCGAMPEEALQTIKSVAAKQNAPLVYAPDQVSALVKHADLHNQTLSLSTADYSLPPVTLPLAGAFQLENTCTALSVMEMLGAVGIPIPATALVTGFSSVHWPGRLQIVENDPLVLLDGAHNPAAAHSLRLALKGCDIRNKVGVVAGFCRDKNIRDILQTLAPIAGSGWAVPINNPRSADPKEVAGIMQMADIKNVTACNSLSQALAGAKEWAKINKGAVLICGSLFLVGEALEFYSPVGQNIGVDHAV